MLLYSNNLCITEICTHACVPNGIAFEYEIQMQGNNNNKQYSLG